MMRIAYEVIKKEDPSAYVVFSGSGFASFTDAILRNTDNPADGKATPQYPNGGGAYFDAVLYNVFPHFDGSLAGYDPALGRLVYRRHSDAASQSIVSHKAELDSVLRNYGYNGQVLPKKQYIIGEINVPRKPLGALGFGGEEIQKNFILKSYITAATNGILSMNIKSVSEEMNYDEAADASQIMGLYKKLSSTPFNRTMNVQGMAFKSISTILFGLDYDSVRTKALILGKNHRGAAFKNKTGKYTYVLWAAIQDDMSEFAKDSFNFPNALNINNLYKREWSFSENQKATLISSKNIQLGGTPIFLSEEAELSKPPVAAFASDFKKACPDLTVKFENKSVDATNYLWRFEGGTPATSTEKTPSVLYTKGGKFNVEMEVKNAQGTHINRKIQYIVVDEKPKADFSFKVENGIDVRFTNKVTNSFSMIWDFGDGTPLDQTLNPTHRFKDKKAYTVKLIAVNDCGRDTIIKVVDLLTSTQDLIEAQRIDFQSFPNPFTYELTVHFNLPESSMVSIDIFDMQGRKVENLVQNQRFTEGVYQVNLNPHLNTKGMFYIQLRTDKVTVFRKVLKM
jgi:PKD repeat protein